MHEALSYCSNLPQVYSSHAHTRAQLMRLQILYMRADKTGDAVLETRETLQRRASGVSDFVLLYE
jgi:hypothetical protein